MAPAPQLLAPRLLGEILGDLGLGVLTETQGQSSSQAPPPATTAPTSQPPAATTNVGSTPTTTAPGSPQPTNSQPSGGAPTTPTGTGTNTLPTFGSVSVTVITDSKGNTVTVTGTPQANPQGQNAIAVTKPTTDAQGHTTYITQYYAPPEQTGAGSGSDNSSGSLNPDGSPKDGGSNSSSSSSPPGSVVGAAVAIVLVVVAIAGVWMFRRWKARRDGGRVARTGRPNMMGRGSVASTVLWGATARDSLHNSNSSRPASDASYHSYEDGATVSSADMSNSTVRFPSGREYDLDAPFGSITPPPGELILQPPATAHTSESSCTTNTHISFSQTTNSYHTALSSMSPFGDENSSPFEDPFAIDTNNRLSSASGNSAALISPFADSFAGSAAPSTPDPHRLSANSDVYRPSCDSTIGSFPSPPTTPPRTGDIPAPSIFSTPYNSQIFANSRASHVSSAQATIRQSQLPSVL